MIRRITVTLFCSFIFIFTSYKLAFGGTVYEYKFKYYYGNGDFYTGSVYTIENKYSVGDTIEYGKNNTGYSGYYKIEDFKIWDRPPPPNDTVVCNKGTLDFPTDRYYDKETDKSIFAFVGIVKGGYYIYGSSGLGSEVGYLDGGDCPRTISPNQEGFLACFFIGTYDADICGDIVVISESARYGITGGGYYVDLGEDVEVLMKPCLGHVVCNVRIDEKPIGAVNDYLFKNINNDHAVGAEFCRENTSNQFPFIEHFNSNISNGAPPLEVEFDCKGKDLDGQIEAYSIDYGDGSLIETNIEGNFSHVFKKNGKFDVICTITDNNSDYISSTPISIFVKKSNISVIPAVNLLLLDDDKRLITSRWSQSGYYRYYYDIGYINCIDDIEVCIASPIVPDDATDDNLYPVGCTAVAVGQLINYYFKKGYRKDWLEVMLQNTKVYPRFGFMGKFCDKECNYIGLPTKDGYSDFIDDWKGPNNEGYLLREFLWAVALGLDSYFTGDHEGTTVFSDFSLITPYKTYQEKIKTLLRDRFRFNPNITYTGVLTRLDAEKDYIINSINKKEPVLVSMSCDAGGHVALIDAYRITSSGEFQVKINFGWNKANENDQWRPTSGAFKVFNEGCLWENFIIFANTTPINY